MKMHYCCIGKVNLYRGNYLLMVRCVVIRKDLFQDIPEYNLFVTYSYSIFDVQNKNDNIHEGHHIAHASF